MTSSKIAHLTSVHHRYDIRIFIKQCRSLVRSGHQTTLLVADGLPEEFIDGVRICGLAKDAGRLKRILNTSKRIFARAVELDADIYQIHDPELIPVGLKLKQLGKKIILDAHEDAPKQMLCKPYLNPLLLRVIAGALSVYERYACAKFDGIITATPFIRDKFLMFNNNTTDINNYPMIGELDAAIPWKEKQPEVCYVGGIASIRGIGEMVRACEFLRSPARLTLAGKFAEPQVEADVKRNPGWARVNELGQVSREGLRTVLGRAVAGLVTFLPLPNHTNAQPNKMFEYMSSGLPVIASNFELWREIIEGNECGICVDPLDPKAIADAIDYCVSNPAIARRMGENGRLAVMNKYNWSKEEKKLLSFYERILHGMH